MKYACYFNNVFLYFINLYINKFKPHRAQTIFSRYLRPFQMYSSRGAQGKQLFPSKVVIKVDSNKLDGYTSPATNFNWEMIVSSPATNFNWEMIVSSSKCC